MMNAVKEIAKGALWALLALPVMMSAAVISSLVYDDPNGVLQYGTYANQDQTNSVNTVPDFSRCGYKGGGVPIPFIPALVTINAPTGEDDLTLIQDAIDQVEALPLQPNGFRGAVLIKAGNYRVSSSLTIQASGVVIRGEGSQLTGGTRITMTATEKDNLFQVSGSGAPAAVAGTTQRITDTYVPVGSTTLSIDSSEGYAVGDEIRVQNTTNTDWIEAIGMDDLSATDPDDTDWTAAAYQLYHERTVTGINANTLTLDAPIVQAIENPYGGGQVFKYTFAGQIENIGFEALRLDSTYINSSDEDHGWIGVSFSDTRNGWLRQVTGQYFGYGLVSINGGCHFFTVEDCAMIDPKSLTTGGRKYSFNLNDSSYVLVQRCYTRGGRHDFVSGSKTFGPNTFVDGRSDETYGDNGPHHRYATGQLYDNIKCGALNVRNRGNSGSGHGWSGAQVMFWNCDVSGVICKVPTGAMSWAIGCVGTRNSSGNEPDGIFESHGTHVTPRSLYYRQLRERLGTDTLLGIILPHQAAGTVWDELQDWGGDGLFLDELVVWHDVVLGTADLRSIVRNLQMLENGITATWSKVSGPGNVIFSDAAALETAASFSASGDYVLRLLVDDSSNPIFQDVAITVNSTHAPVAHWKLDDGNGSTALDHSGNGHNGMVAGGTWVSGQDGGALDFNRAGGDKITIPAAAFATVSNAVSMAFWAYGDAAVLPQTSFAIRAVDASGNRVFSIALPHGNQNVYWDAGNSGSSSYDRISKVAATSEYEGQWNHWVFTKDAVSGVMEIYLNGVLWHNGTELTRTMNGIASTYISGDGSEASYDGALDDFRVYDKALSSTEAAALYGSYFPAPPIFTSDLIVAANGQEDTKYSGTIADTAFDSDFDTMIFSKMTGPAWLSVDATGALSGMPSESDVGLNRFIVEVSDGRSGTNSATLEITVDARNWTVYTVTGFDNGAGTITTDHGALSSTHTFVDRDVLVVDEAGLNGFTFDGWDLSNLTIQAVAGGLNHFRGITFAANTTVNGLTMDSYWSFRSSPEPVFAGGVSGVTFIGHNVLREANEMLSTTDWNGATIHADSGSGYDIGFINWETVNVDFNGATIYAGKQFIRSGSNYDKISWEGVTFNIVGEQIWRQSNSSDNIGAERGFIGRNWNHSTINATGGGLFDSYSTNAFAGTYTFDGADVNGDLFKGTSNHEISQPTTVDFSGADVGDLADRDISGLTNLTVVFNPATTTFGVYTQGQAIADGWVAIESAGSYHVWAAGYPELINSAPEFDQEPDGMANLMEYALGADPTLDDAESVLPYFMRDDDHFYYVYRRQNPKDPSLSYQVLSGNDLRAELTDEVAEIDVSTVDSKFESVTSALPITTTPTFMYLKIEYTTE